MIRQIQYGIAWLLVSVVAFTACQQEEFEAGGEQALPEGSYEVHFYPEQGYGSKSVHDNQPKSVRISSLKYLRYNSAYALQKSVDIPVDETTVWPMRRETMTWDQREALKDTLEERSTYYIAFVANWDRVAEGQDEAHSLLQDTVDLQNTYLKLPDAPFEDDNMFYLFTDSISNQLTGVDRDHPYNCPVLLQRIVTRQDFWGEQLPEWKEGEQLPEGEKNPAEGVVHEFSRKLFMQFCFAEEGAFLKERTNASMTIFWETVKKEFTAENGTTNDAIKKIDDEIKLVDVKLALSTLLPDEKAKLQAQKAELQAQKTQLQAEVEVLTGYIAQCDAIIASIPQDIYYQQLMAINENENALALDKVLFDQCMQNVPLKTVFTNRWEGKSVSLKYNSSSQTTASGSGANRFYLFNWQSKNGITESVKMPVDTTKTVGEITYHGFTWVGFGKNLSQSAAESNVISRLAFYEEGTTQVVFELDAKDCTTSQTGNQHYQAVYKPIESISYNEEVGNVEGYTELEHSFVCDLAIFFTGPTEDPDAPTDPTEPAQDSEAPTDPTDPSEPTVPSEPTAPTDLQTAIKQLLNDETKELGKTYGTDPTKLKLTIQIPDLRNDKALIITPKWTVTNVGR